MELQFGNVWEIAHPAQNLYAQNPIGLATLVLTTPFQLISNVKNKIGRFDAEALLAHLLGITIPELYIYDGIISNGLIDKFNAVVKKRAAGIPLQYIIGKTEFMGLEFIVTPDVFIPRPETELLVEETIKTIRSTLYAIRCPRILDVGTGSGNIAISLTKFLPNCKIMALDISREAIAIAKENALLNLVDKRIEFLASDLFEALPKRKFDIIISNPPYVASRQFSSLQKEVTFEPRIALNGGPYGTDFYKRIVNGIHKFLKTDGYLVLEIGAGQDEAIPGILREAGFREIRFVKDYSSINRIIVAKWIPLQTVVQVTGRK